MALSSSPGIFWVNSRITTPNLLSYPDYVTWYENVHTPDWMAAKPGAISAAWRYQAVDTTRALPFLVVYRYNDVAYFDSPEFRTVPLTHPSLPHGGPITDFVEMQAISGPNIDSWKRSVATGERGPLLVSEGIDPARNISDQVFNNWYRQTYIKEISQAKGWRRTSRFDNTMKGGFNTKIMPRWLALHEFDEGAFEGGTKISGLLGQSKETKDIEHGATQIDIALFTLAREYGNKTISWGNSDAQVA